MLDTFFMFMPDVVVENVWLLYQKSSNYQYKLLGLLGFRLPK